jgi:hypothetical protein
MVCVSAVTVSDIVSGEKEGADVKHDFGYALLKVVPETSFGFNGYNEQTIVVTNQEKESLYYYLNPYFENKDLRSLELFEIGTKEVIVNTRDYSDCVFDDAFCKGKPNGTRTNTVLDYKPLTALSTGWGDSKHNFNEQGVLIKSGETKSFLVKYRTLTDKGKWNMRIWANTKDDWTCIEDNKWFWEDCPYNAGTIDPTFDISNMTINMTSYWKFDKGTGTFSVDSNTTNNNGLTLSGVGGWSWAGIIGNASYYAGIASQFRNTSSTNMPSSKGAVSLWYRMNVTGTKDHYLFELSDNTINNRHILALDTSGSNRIYTLSRKAGGTYYYTIICSPITNFSVAGTWFYLVYQWNDNISSQTAIYINGTNLTGCTFPGSFPTNNFQARQNISLGNAYLSPSGSTVLDSGNIDEMGIWYEKQLTQTEITGLYNAGAGCTHPFTSCALVPDPGYNFTVRTNITYTSTPQYETNGTYVYINFSYAMNVSNISSVDLNIYDQNITPTQLSNGSCGTNCTYQYYGAFTRNPLVLTNGTSKSFNFTYVSNYNNATSYSNSTANQTMTIYWAYLPTNIWIENQRIETFNTTWNVSYKSLGNDSDVSFVYLTEYNGTNNLTGTMYQNGTILNATFNFTVPFLNTTDVYKIMSMKPYFNITYNGTSYVRNGSAGATILSANQGTYKMLINLTNTTCSYYADVPSVNYSIRYLNSSLADTSDVNATILVYLSDISLNRTYTFNISNNATPYLCIYPNSTSYTFSSVNYTVNWDFDVRDDYGNYIVNSVTGANISNASVLYIIYYDYDSTIIATENYNTSDLYETSSQNYYVNYSWSMLGNVTNVSSSDLNLNGTMYVGTYLGGNSSQSQFAVLGARIPLVQDNNTNITFLWTYNKTMTNASTGNYYNTSAHNQAVIYAYVPLNIFIETPIIETYNTTWNVTYLSEGNTTDVVLEYITQWNNTNITGTMYDNSTRLNSSFNYQTPFLNNTVDNATFTMTPYINITYNGTSQVRNGSSGLSILSATQQVYKMILTNCSTTTTTQTNQFYIHDTFTFALLNADSTINYSIWLPTNPSTYSRNYIFNFTSNNSPQTCIYPPFANYNSSSRIVANLTGYTTNTVTFADSLSNTSITHIVYLTSLNLTTPFTYYVVDSSENPLNNYTIQTFLYYPATTTQYLISTDTTDITGSVVAFLPLNNYFKWTVYDPTNLSVLNMGPTYVLSTSTSKTFIVGENASDGLDVWIKIYGLSCSVTWNSALNVTSLTWNATSVNLSQTCFNLFNLSGGDFVLFSQNCSASLNGTLSLFAGYSDTSWLSYPTVKIIGDNTTYILNCGGESPLSFSTALPSASFGTEGVFWAMVLLILVATMGLMGEGASYISMMLIIAWVPAVSLWNLIPWTYSTIIGIISFLVIWIMGVRRERG